MENPSKKNREVFIVDGCRTPFLKSQLQPGPFSAADLAVAAGKIVLERQPLDSKEINEVVLGSVMPREDEANIARIVTLRLGCGSDVPAWTVQRNCGSGMQSVDSAAKDIRLGRYDIALAGGTEAMSHAPLLFNQEMVHWYIRWASAKSLGQRLKLITQLRLHYLKPIIALRRGLSDPVVGLSMGQTAENLAYQFHIDRQQMDEFALMSHQRVIYAYEHHFMEEVVPLYDYSGHVHAVDTGVRRDTSLEKLSSLKPFFDPYGTITAGNSSQVTDGAALLLLASGEAVNRYQLPVMGRIVDVEWSALPPDVMGLGPCLAIPPIMKRQRLSIDDIDYWEINEAFAAQVLACLAAWKDAEFCRKHFDLTKAFGEVDLSRLNVDGGAIALGHPVGASGARIILHLLHILKREKAKRGIAAICIGGGQGGAMLIERC